MPVHQTHARMVVDALLQMEEPLNADVNDNVSK